MAQVVRFFHVRPTSRWYEQYGFDPLPRGGATVRVVGEDDGKAVRVQVAYCSPKDQFCRKTGRARAETKQTVAIPLSGLPGMLTKVSRNVMRKQHLPGAIMGSIVARNWRSRSELWHRDWSFATKYWTPKASQMTSKELGTLLRERQTENITP